MGQFGSRALCLVVLALVIGFGAQQSDGYPECSDEINYSTTGGPPTRRSIGPPPPPRSVGAQDRRGGLEVEATDADKGRLGVRDLAFAGLTTQLKRGLYKVG